MTGVTLYVGGTFGTLQHERDTLTGTRCSSAIYRPRRQYNREQAMSTLTLLDSGAFSDKPAKRLSFDGALQRQLWWEDNARRLWECPAWRLEIVASYDYLLIDEVWEDDARRKQRWARNDAWAAADVSACAALYLSKQRKRLYPRLLAFGCQGTDAEQYAWCAEAILNESHENDIFAFGGRCILGRQRSLLPEHYETLIEVIPMIAQAGLKRVHIFGVLYDRAIAPMAWLCDQYGLALSTDSIAPIKGALGKNLKKSGARRPYWRDNVAWWQEHLANIKRSHWYRNPADLLHSRQLSLFERN